MTLHRKFWMGAVGLYLLALLVGSILFLRPRPTPASPRIETPGVQSLDPADYRSGARVRVSGYDWFRSHHPLYAIDGQDRPTPLEKWASLRGDAAPWLEVLLAGPRDWRAVRLVFAGALENPAYTSRDYALRCFRGERELARLSVRANTLHRPEHPLACSQADRLRIDFSTEPGSARDVVRLYEVDLVTSGPEGRP